MNRLLRLLVILSIPAAVLFGSAGQWGLPAIWAYLTILAGLGLAFLLAVDPDLQEERLSLEGEGEGRLFRLALLPCALAHWAVAGLDAGRFHWSGTVPWAAQLLGLVVFASGLALVWWAMRVNRFFSPAIQVGQKEGHRVITAGPYAWVRHPGYLGMVVAFAGSGPALGSWWAILPTLSYALLLAWRTAREDGVLRARLTGYPEYARRVPSRLLPGIW